jgi:hypothetical protein
MSERTATEVLAEKLNDLAGELYNGPDPAKKYGQFGSMAHFNAIAARLAEDPAITVRTDMVVERFVVEFHYEPAGPLVGLTVPLHTDAQVHLVLTHRSEAFIDNADHRIIVRPFNQPNLETENA